jgi:peptidoglycan/xylan/chitin deacetylase (PgdA/CDA1 family)
MTKVLMTFPHGKFKVLTLSYDDGRNADRRLVQLMNDYGIKGTFHLNSGLFGAKDRVSREDIAELFRGHEISAHTVTHPTIARCPKEQLVHEIMEDRMELESIAGYTVRGMSYPNGSFNKAIKEILPMLGIEYSRVTESTGGFGMPDDWHEWKPTCHHYRNRNLLQLTESFLAANKSQYLYMMYVWGHSYEFDNDNNWELIETFCARAGRRDDIWYATNIEIVDYVKSFHRLQFSASRSFVYNPSASPVWIQANGKIVEIGGGSQVQLT